MLVTTRVRDVKLFFFKNLHKNKDKALNGTYEIINACFIADEPTIFDKLKGVNEMDKDIFNTNHFSFFKMDDKAYVVGEGFISDPITEEKIFSEYAWSIFKDGNDFYISLDANTIYPIRIYGTYCTNSPCVTCSKLGCNTPSERIEIIHKKI